MKKELKLHLAPRKLTKTIVCSYALMEMSKELLKFYRYWSGEKYTKVKIEPTPYCAADVFHVFDKSGNMVTAVAGAPNKKLREKPTVPRSRR